MPIIGQPYANDWHGRCLKWAVPTKKEKKREKGGRGVPLLPMAGKLVRVLFVY